MEMDREDGMLNMYDTPGLTHVINFSLSLAQTNVDNYVINSDNDRFHCFVITYDKPHY